MAQRDGRSEEEGRIALRIKEEDIPIEINTAVPRTHRNVKLEEEEICVSIKEEEVPVEIGTGGFSNVDAQCVPLHPGGCMKTEDGLSQDFQDGKQIKVEVKEEVEDIKVRADKVCKQEDLSMEISRDGSYATYDDVIRANKAETFPPNISDSRSQLRTEASAGVLPKPLSREEKLEILTQKLLEKNRFPWLEGGCFPSNPKRDPNNPDHMDDKDAHKIGHTDWCRCRNCVPLPSGGESVCCMEISEIRPHLKGITCITQHPHFTFLCENKDFAHIHQNMMYGLRTKIPKERDQNRALRKAAYQTFSVWIHGALGKKRERPIPACTVHKVRTAFPGSEHAACCEDYPADQMIFS